MSSEQSNAPASVNTSTLSQINSTIKPVHLVLATRVDDAGSVEVMEWVDGAVQTPSGDRNTHKVFVWPERTEFPDITDACVEILAWDSFLEYTVSGAKQTEETSRDFMEARRDAYNFQQMAQETDEDQDMVVANKMNKRLEDSFRNLRNAQERMNGSIMLSEMEARRFFDHLGSLGYLTNMQRPTDARFTAERDLMWKTATRCDVLMRKLRASCYSIQMTNDRRQELSSLNKDLVETQDALVVIESKINKGRYREMRDLDILTSKDKGKGAASASDGKEDASGEEDVLEGAIGLHVAPDDPSFLEVFPVLRWKDDVSTRLSPYLSPQGLEPQVPAGAGRLDEDTMDHIPFVFHLEDGVPPVTPKFQNSLTELMTTCTKWLEDMKNPQGSMRTKLLKLGSSASETSPQDIDEVSKMSRLEYDRLGFIQRAPPILPRAFDRFEVAARRQLKTSISNALERGTTEKSSSFARLWVDLIRAEVESSLWEGKSEISRISSQASKVKSDKKAQTRRRRKEEEQTKTASGFRTLASKLKVQTSEAATKLGVAVPTSFDELVEVLEELDAAAADTEMPVTPTIITSTHDDWPSNQGQGLFSPAPLSPLAMEGLEAELDKLHIPSSGIDERLLIPVVPSPINADWHSQETAGFLDVPSPKKLRSNSDVTSEHSVATTSSTALVFARFVPDKPTGFQTDQWYKEHNRFRLYEAGLDEEAFMIDFIASKYVLENEDDGDDQEDQDAADTAT
ncbi:hypothetical protein EHS25_009827 [Saitozyma podzolica]|uniref:Uncharacterized protein n=1 Tax=Saitozyma podzolica TaxID=1890683 RepID=A0A427YKA3_9TREE|nr:hypothetical protein EHS25_009827 [Saitozyma podzolica]